jgi:hypothetical protein
VKLKNNSLASFEGKLASRHDICSIAQSTAWRAGRPENAACVTWLGRTSTGRSRVHLRIGGIVDSFSCKSQSSDRQIL